MYSTLNRHVVYKMNPFFRDYSICFQLFLNTIRFLRKIYHIFGKFRVTTVYLTFLMEHELTNMESATQFNSLNISKFNSNQIYQIKTSTTSSTRFDFCSMICLSNDHFLLLDLFLFCLLVVEAHCLAIVAHEL